VQVISFLDGSDNTIGTMVNWANHPETVADENVLFTSDYVHALRESVSHGVTWDGESKPGVGGITMFMNGTVGGMMTSLGVNVDTPDGETGGSASFEKADAIGQLVGGMALDALAGGQDVEAPSLAFATKTFELNVDNQAFQAMFLLGVLDHRKAVFDESQPLSDDNVPVVTTEMDIVDLGPVRMLSVPGELLPELAIGGYDGSYTPATRDIIDPGNDNPPDLAAAPRGPYLKDDMGADYNWILGLGNDELGYIVPPYNFKLNQAAPYILEDFGDHYEETNSLGVDTAPKILEEAAILIDWMNEQ
jgi:hypothetical protein